MTVTDEVIPQGAGEFDPRVTEQLRPQDPDAPHGENPELIDESDER
jgi:hypothetical protein